MHAVPLNGASQGKKISFELIYDPDHGRSPVTSQRLVEISWHRKTRQLGVILHGDRRWSFEAVEAMRQLGIDALA